MSGHFCFYFMISLCSCVCREQLNLEKVFSSPFSELAGERCQYRNKGLVAMVCLCRNPPPHSWATDCGEMGYANTGLSLCECLRPDGAFQTPSPLAERELACPSLVAFPSYGIQQTEREHPCSAPLPVPSEETPGRPMVSLGGEEGACEWRRSQPLPPGPQCQPFLPSLCKALGCCWKPESPG